MAVKLHRCPLEFIKGPHPCWRVQKALEEAGVDYQVVRGPLIRRRRVKLAEQTGQRLYPAIEREDGSWVKRDAAELVAMIEAGEFGPEA